MIIKHPEIAEFAITLYCLGISHHDDYGQISADPHDWKYNVFPVSENNHNRFIKALFALESVGLIIKSRCGKAYLYVNYEKHQTFRPDRSRTKEYANIDWDGMTMVNHGIPPTTTGLPLDTNAALREVNISKVNISKDNKTVEEEKGKSKPFEKDFLVAWKEYPNKIEKKNAYNAYVARRREGTSYQDLHVATINYAKKVKGNTFIKMGKTFYGPNEVWKDFVSISMLGGEKKVGEEVKLKYHEALLHALETDNPVLMITREQYDEMSRSLDNVFYYNDLEKWFIVFESINQ